MRRLYQKIYLTIIVSLVAVVAVAGAFWRAGFDSSPAGQAYELAGESKPARQKAPATATTATRLTMIVR